MRFRASAACVLVSLLSLGAATQPASDPASTEDKKIAAAKADVAAIVEALEAYNTDTNHYPATEEGLAALVKAPAGTEGWKGPYLKSVPTDPWGHAYIYRQPTAGEIEVFSCGPDGKEGTTDDIKS